MNSRGVLGSIIMLFISTVIIFLILILFTFGSGVVKIFDRGSGVSVYSQDEIITGGKNPYSIVVESRVRIQEGQKGDLIFQKVLEEFSYEK
ncbi:MAG: hypothetical protein ABIF88_01715 [archaeon]